jgi:hypothetical protein
VTDIKITTGDLWDSGLEDDLIRPLAEKALIKFGDFVVKNKQHEFIMDGHQIRMLLNDVLHNGFFREHMLSDKFKKAEHQVNIEVGVPAGKPEKWFVGIWYRFKDGHWQDETKEITTY